MPFLVCQKKKNKHNFQFHSEVSSTNLAAPILTLTRGVIEEESP